MRNALHISMLILLLCCFVQPGSDPIAATGFSRQSDSMHIARHRLERAERLYDQSAYDSLPFYYQTAQKIFHAGKAYDMAARCFLGMVDYYRLTGSTGRALELMDRAESYILRHLHRQTESWADALYTRAKLNYQFNRTEAAIALLEEAIHLYQKLGDPPRKISRCRDVLGSLYLVHGDLEKSLANYLDAYRILAGLNGGHRAELGNLMFNIGLVYNRKRDFDNGAEFIRRAIENHTALYGPDFPELANAYNGLASHYIRKGMTDSARVCLDEAERIFLQGHGEVHLDHAGILVNRARVARLEGDHHLALEYYRQALRSQEALDHPRESLIRDIYVNMVNIHQAMGQYRDAALYLDRLMQYEGRVHPERMAGYYLARAGNLLYLGAPGEAAVDLNRVAEIRDRALPVEDPQRIYEYLLFARLHDTLRQPGRAEAFLRRALDISRNTMGEHHPQTMEIKQAIAAHHLHAGQAEEALAMVQSALHSLFPGQDSLSLLFHPSPEQSQHPLAYLEVLELKTGILDRLIRLQPEDALRYWQVALEAGKTSIRLVEFLRNTYPAEKSMLYISEQQRDLYSKCIQAAWKCHALSGEKAYLAAAFETAEKAKYATLVASIRREDALRFAGVPDTLGETLDRLKMELSIVREILHEARNEEGLPDRSRIRYFENEAFRISDRLARIYEGLKAEYPGYFDLLYNHRVAAPAEIQQILRRGDLLLEYFLGPEYLYVFSLRKKGFGCMRHARSAIHLEDNLKMVTDYTSADLLNDTTMLAHADFFQAAHELYRHLIPAGAGDKHLILIPEGKLAYLPFDALVSEPVRAFNGLYDRVPFLLRDFSMRHAYSATLMTMDRREKTRGRHALVAFAPGYLQEADRAAGQDPERIEIRPDQLTALPYSIQEVNDISKMLGGTAFTGTRASESRFKALAPESRIIHLAAHTFLDDAEPLQSKIVFADPREDGEGYLNAYEIYALDLKAAMVVLSACNTGMGTMQSGEGIMSLARAFRYAGVPNIMMSLRTVSDRNSYELMHRFYRALSMGFTTERALQKAKLEYLHEASPSFKHPQYWAGFILAGNADRVLIPLYIKILMGLALIGFLAGTGWALMKIIRWRRVRAS